MDSCSGLDVPGMRLPTAVPTTAWPLVRGDDDLLSRGQDGPLLLDARHGAKDRGLEVFLAHGGGTGPAREQRSLVHEVRQLGAREPSRHRRDLVDVQPLAHGQVPIADVNPEDLLAPLLIRTLHAHRAIEPPWAFQRAVQGVRPVRRGETDHEVLVVETVQLGEQLVERLLALVVPHAPQTPVAPALGDGVDLVDEHDRGRLLPGARGTRP